MDRILLVIVALFAVGVARAETTKADPARGNAQTGACATVTYRAGVPAFRFEKDAYMMRNDATCAWSADRHFEVTVPKRNFWMHYGAFPGMKPFRGPNALTLVTDIAYPAEIAIHLRAFPGGKVQKFKAPWRERTRFETKLDSGKLYQLETIEIYRSKWDDRPWKVKFLELEGEFSSSEADAISVEVETGNPLHLVRAGRAEHPELVLRNMCDAVVRLKGALALKGFDGESHPVQVEVALSGGETHRLPLPEVTRKGVWRVAGTLAAGDGSTCKVETRFAVVDFHRATPKQPKGTFRLGVNYHMSRFSPEDRRLTLMALNACGAKLVRAGIGISMSAVQRTGPDDWDFSSADRNLELLEDAGLAVDDSVFFIPMWAARPENRTNANWHVWAEGRPELGLLERFCERLARRYGTRIDYYETGNEWDLGFTGTLDEAVEIQREVYTGVKKGCPDACVIMNGWAAPGNNPQVERSGHKDFHENFLRRAGNLFDVHPIHIHGGFSSYANEIENQFFPLRERTGVAKKPWYSNETAITSVWGERQTATTVWKKILYAWSMGSTDYIWYNLKGTGWNPKDPEQGYGLITADYLPREGYVAFAALATAVGGKTFRRTVFRKASRFVMELADAREIALCAWDETASDDVRVQVKTDAKRAWQVDLMGNRAVAAIKDGKVDFTFGSQPAALVLEGASFAEPDARGLNDIPPPNAKPILIPPHRAGRAPDFTLDRPEQVNDFYEANPAEIKRLWKGPRDLSAKVWLVREDRGIRLLVDVEDDVHAQACRPGEQYMGDDVQVAFASHLQNGHWELGLARRDDGAPMTFCWISPSGHDPAKAAARIELKTTRSGVHTCYDALFPYDAFGFDKTLPLQGLRFNLLVNDNDGDGRDAFIELLPNNFSSKDAGTYPFVKFRQ